MKLPIDKKEFYTILSSKKRLQHLFEEQNLVLINYGIGEADLQIYKYGLNESPVAVFSKDWFADPKKIIEFTNKYFLELV